MGRMGQRKQRALLVVSDLIDKRQFEVAHELSLLNGELRFLKNKLERLSEMNVIAVPLEPVDWDGRVV